MGGLFVLVFFVKFAALILAAGFLLIFMFQLTRRFLARARRRKALAGARLWLTGIFLFLLFALIGAFWGFLSV
ncbi:MAG: hypothetical protein KC777_29540 [Cyanobacteria bacterium HKST-UBA02]|nr:hypothetical protein [Cyanobacteria bacterium HKST-UBA02]